MNRIHTAPVYTTVFLVAVLCSIVTMNLVLNAQSCAPVPCESDWTDQGTIISPVSSTWESCLGGAASPVATIDMTGSKTLLYIGAEDCTPQYRKLGVAVDTGSGFTKYFGNPILTHSPFNDDEEGVFGGGVLEEGGAFYFYCGCMEASGQNVIADVDLYKSTDGTTWVAEAEVVLDSQDSSVFGYGDELLPYFPFKDGSTYYLYYVAKTEGNTWDLALASGPARDNFTSTVEVLDSGSKDIISMNAVIDGSTIILFLFREDGSGDYEVEVRTAPLSDPTDISAVVTTYDFTGLLHLVVEKDGDNWTMYHRDESSGTIKYKTASLSGPTPTPTPVPPTPTPTPGPTATPTPTPAGVAPVCTRATDEDQDGLHETAEVVACPPM